MGIMSMMIYLSKHSNSDWAKEALPLVLGRGGFGFSVLLLYFNYR